MSTEAGLAHRAVGAGPMAALLLCSCAGYRVLVDGGASGHPPFPPDAPVQVSGGAILGLPDHTETEAAEAACPQADADNRALIQGEAMRLAAGATPRPPIEYLATLRFEATGRAGTLAPAAELAGLARATARRLGGNLLVLRGGPTPDEELRADVYRVECGAPRLGPGGEAPRPPDL